MSNAQYRDSGCPSQCMSINDYAPSSGTAESCPIECLTNYANPNSSITCPSSCNYYNEYSTVGGIYDTFIPASTASRIIPSPSVTDDYLVQNNRITNFSGNVSNVIAGANLNNNATTSNLIDLNNKLKTTLTQLDTAAIQAQNASTSAQNAANATPVILQNQGPASASVNVATAAQAAQNSQSLATSATALAANANVLAANVLEASRGLPASDIVTQAVASATNASDKAAKLAADAQTSATNANLAASNAANVVSNTKEGFRLLEKLNVSGKLMENFNRAKHNGQQVAENFRFSNKNKEHFKLLNQPFERFENPKFLEHNLKQRIMY
jgi:hypothetical protein